MASQQSKRKIRKQLVIVSLILAIGRIELAILQYISRWIVRIFIILLGISISYGVFYCFFILPSPHYLPQYQKVPSISIYDSNKTLLYKEWNTQRNNISEINIQQLRDVLPPKREMSEYLAHQTTALKNINDTEWFQKKTMYLYPYNTIAAIYINAKVYQNGVVGGVDAAEVYFQKNLLTLEKKQAKQLLSIGGFVMKKNIYSRMSTEVCAICSYIKGKTTKKSGWIRIDTSLDAKTGVEIAYQSLLDPKREITIIEGNKVRAWTQKNDQLLAVRAITKIKEGGEKNE